MSDTAPETTAAPVAAEVPAVVAETPATPAAAPAAPAGDAAAPAEKVEVAAAPAVKVEEEVVVSDELAAKIKKQILFYFSDSNLRQDKFMNTKMAGNSGKVLIDILMTFKKLQQLTTDPKVVAKVFEDCDTLDLDEARKALSRKEPFHLHDKDEYVQRSIYAAGLPSETTIEAVTECFSKYGKVLFVKRLRVPRTDRHSSKPTSNKRSSEAVADSEENVAKKAKVDEESMQEDKEVKAEPAKVEEAAKTPSAYSGAVFVEFATVAEADAAFAAAAEISMDGQTATVVEKMADRLKKMHEERATLKKADAPEEAPVEVKEVVFEPKCVIAFKTSKEDLDREYFESFFGGEWKQRIAFIDYQRGSTDGHLRFVNNEAIADCVEKMSALEEFPEVKILEGEEEKAYHGKAAAARLLRKKSGGRGGGRGGRGGRGRGRGRGGRR